MLINFRANLIDLICIAIMGKIMRVREFNLKGNKTQNFYQVWRKSNLIVAKFTQMSLL